MREKQRTPHKQTKKNPTQKELETQISHFVSGSNDNKKDPIESRTRT